ncbi:MAG TPA: IMP dehydrogenase [Paenalcaligenes sp.]|nr:IMP dehydrogenase [Paenalcaligenes sp.]
MHLVQKALTFDDVLLVPAYSEVLPHETNLQSQFTRDIQLNIPLVSAAMDTVTESKLAIAMAREGGIGVIHKNMSIDSQASEVSRVKRHEFGIVIDPVTVSPDMTVRDAIELQKQHGISGLPVVQGNELVGIVTNRDLRFEERLDLPLHKVMTPKDRLVTMREGATLEQAQSLMHEHRLERVLIVNDDFQLRGLATVKDILKSTEHPRASKDQFGQLRVAAAVGVAGDTEARVDALVKVGVDAIVVDTAHGHTKGVIDRVRWIKENYPAVQVIGGNIATGDAARALYEVGADAVKVGIGPGSICTTRVIAGVGMPQVSAIDDVSKALKGTGVPLIADGGIRFSGDVAKALAAGASTCMMGGMFAGTEEAPGEVVLYKGRSYKAYRGMGSIGAMVDGSADRYFQESGSSADKLVPEGIEGRVPYKGSVIAIIHQLTGGVRASMGYCGAGDIPTWHDNAKFIEVTAAGYRESHVHDVQISKEAPNYRVG